MTRFTATERDAIALQLRELQAEQDRIQAERDRLQALLDASPVVGDETVRFLRPMCPCGLSLDHRQPFSGEPRPCADETARIALAPPRSLPPVRSAL